MDREVVVVGVLCEVVDTHNDLLETEVVDVHYFRVILAYFQHSRNATLG